MISGGNKRRLIRLTLTVIPGCKKLKIVNIKVNPSGNIHLNLKFYVDLKYVRVVSSAVLQKME